MTTGKRFHVAWPKNRRAVGGRKEGAGLDCGAGVIYFPAGRESG